MTIKIFTCALVLSIATMVHAQPVDKTQTAKQYVSAGLAAQKAGDYDTALTFYGKAYELVPHPVLLFNMAQANRLAGRTDKAIELYKKYLEANPQGPQAKVAKDFVAEHDAQVAAEEAKRKAEADAAAAKRDQELSAEQARKAEAARKQQEARDQQLREQEAARKQQQAREAEAAAQQPAPVASDDGRPLRIAGIAMAGTGAVAVGVGVLFGLHARSLSNELSASGAVYDPQKVSDGQAANRNMLISTIAGSALVAGGVVVYIVGSKKQSSDRVALVPIVFAGGGGLALGGSLR
jgi:tetratricopeptide (TPR) repeat protein